MKRFKSIACFLLMFSLTFSEESSIEAEQKARITQLEQQIETQNKIIARYERLEGKIDTRISQSLDLDKEVKKAYKENLNEIEGRFQSKINWILALVSFAFGVVALISIMPLYQSWSSRKTIKKLEEQREILEDQDEKINLALGETYHLFMKEARKELQDSDESNFERNYVRFFWWLILSTEFHIKREGDQEVFDNITWVFVPFRINEEKEFNVSEEKIIKDFQEMLDFSKPEYQYIKDNLEGILDLDESRWNEKERKLLKKLLKPVPHS